MLEEFGPERTRDCPISEAAISGTAAGAAMTGLHPIVDNLHDFGDAVDNRQPLLRLLHVCGKGQSR